MPDEVREERHDHNFITCSACGRPCYIIHDLDMSECCLAPVDKWYRQTPSEPT